MSRWYPKHEVDQSFERNMVLRRQNDALLKEIAELTLLVAELRERLGEPK